MKTVWYVSMIDHTIQFFGIYPSDEAQTVALKLAEMGLTVHILEEKNGNDSSASAASVRIAGKA